MVIVAHEVVAHFNMAQKSSFNNSSQFTNISTELAAKNLTSGKNDRYLLLIDVFYLIIQEISFLDIIAKCYREKIIQVDTVLLF